MYRRSLVLCMFIAVGTLYATAADKSQPAMKLSAAEIVDKNVSARGGLAAWRAVKALSMSGKIDAGGNSRPVLPLRRSRKDRGQPLATPRPLEQVQLPLVIELKRSHKSRIELQFNGQTAIQAFDGTNGWKIRPFLNRKEVEPYTADELKAALQEAELDGPLVDYQAKGSKVELVGSEKVGDRDTYHLAVTTRSGQVQHIWVDSQSFLEVKMEGSPRLLDGKLHPVEIYYAEFRPATGGLVVPYLYETKVEGVKQTEKIQIESVLVNPKLDDTLFAKPR
jgi:hypothetical protein